MEPLRGFPQFIRALPELMQTRPEICVEIAGEDSSHYLGSPPKAFSSWGSWAKQFLESHGVASQVKWLGHLPLTKYVNWLQRSWCHVYLTHPFVASWSLVEALACGTKLLVSDVAPVREFCEGQSNVSFVDHRDEEALSLHLAQALQAKQEPDPANRRQQLLQRCSLESSLSSWSRVSGLKLTTNH
jgi:glycosyltransferase involved in cell wall biosynthesis